MLGLDADAIELLERSGLRTDGFGVDDLAASPMWRSMPREGSLSIENNVLMLAPPRGGLGYPVSAPSREVGLTPSPRSRHGSWSKGSSPETGSTVGSAITCFLPTGVPGPEYLAGHVWRDADGATVVLGVSGDEFKKVTIDHDRVRRTSVLASPAADLSVLHLFSRIDGEGQATWGFAGNGFGGPLGLSALELAETDVPVRNPRWAGLVATRIGNGDGEPAPVDFNDVRVFEPQSPRGHVWLAFRDPTLGGRYDLNTAQLQVDKQRPAHNLGFVVDDKRGFLLGQSGLGRAPLWPQINADD